MFLLLGTYVYNEAGWRVCFSFFGSYVDLIIVDIIFFCFFVAFTVLKIHSYFMRCPTDSMIITGVAHYYFQLLKNAFVLIKLPNRLLKAKISFSFVCISAYLHAINRILPYVNVSYHCGYIFFKCFIIVWVISSMASLIRSTFDEIDNLYVLNWLNLIVICSFSCVVFLLTDCFYFLFKLYAAR